MIFAIEKKNLEIVNLIVEHRGRDLDYVLEDAVDAESIEIFDKILSVIPRDDNFVSRITNAAFSTTRNKNEEIGIIFLQKLLEAGAKTIDSDGEDLLEEAQGYGHNKMVKFLSEL